MNGNPYSSHWIGATGEYPIFDYVNLISSNSSNFTILNSNILETHLYDTRESLQLQINKTSNLIYTDNNSNVIIKLIAQNPNYQYYPLTETPIEMLFTTTEGEVKTKINQDGELMVYHPLAPLPAGFSPGWWGVENKIANIITDTQGLRFDVTQLQAATGATAITDSATASAAAAGAAAGAASGAATTAAAGAAIAQGDYGTVAVGVAAGALFSVLGYLSYQAQIESNLTSNGFTTEAAQVHSNIITANGLVADNIGNIVTAKGFVHSNMLFAQNYINSNTVADLYLPKTGNINLNQVNSWISTDYGTYYDITDGTLGINATPTQEDFLIVGGQTTIQGEFICENKIKENNIYLCNVYANINNLNIASNTLNDKIDNYSILSSNYTSINSNILNDKIDNYSIISSNYTSINSNTLNTKIDQTLNNLFSQDYISSNIAITQGFINSNIESQQIISNLKCENCFLSNLNNIHTSNLTTSNTVKSIVEFDMNIVAKHYGFYITITTPININGTTYYKYDIDLTKYTKKGIIQIGPQSGDTFRSFKIRVMYATMYFSYIINDLPNVCYYEVFMSYKNTASPPNGSAGLNACSIGFPPNPTLQAIMPNNLFVIKNGAGSIDYITVVSSSAADCRVIIEDLIG